MKRLPEIRANYHRMIRHSYFLQAGNALLGAFCLYMAIDCFLEQRFFWSAVQTCIAFYAGYQFIGEADHRSAMRAEVTKIKELEREIERQQLTS